MPPAGRLMAFVRSVSGVVDHGAESYLDDLFRKRQCGDSDEVTGALRHVRAVHFLANFRASGECAWDIEYEKGLFNDVVECRSICGEERFCIGVSLPDLRLHLREIGRPAIGIELSRSDELAIAIVAQLP